MPDRSSDSSLTPLVAKCCAIRMSVLGIEKTVSRDIFSERDSKLAKAIRELTEVVESLIVVTGVSGLSSGSRTDA